MALESWRLSRLFCQMEFTFTPRGGVASSLILPGPQGRGMFQTGFSRPLAIIWPWSQLTKEHDVICSFPESFFPYLQIQKIRKTVLVRLRYSLDWFLLKKDHLRTNVAPDQTIILGLQIFLDHRSLSSIGQKILMILPPVLAHRSSSLLHISTVLGCSGLYWAVLGCGLRC